MVARNSSAQRLLSSQSHSIVFNANNMESCQPKRKRRMTAKELCDYKATRKRGACTQCRRLKEKCTHLIDVEASKTTEDEPFSRRESLQGRDPSKDDTNKVEDLGEAWSSFFPNDEANTNATTWPTMMFGLYNEESLHSQDPTFGHDTLYMAANEESTLSWHDTSYNEPFTGNEVLWSTDNFTESFGGGQGSSGVIRKH